MARLAHLSVLLSGAMFDRAPLKSVFFFLSLLGYNMVKITSYASCSHLASSGNLIPASAYKHSFIFHLTNVSPARAFRAKSFAVFEGKDKLNFLSAVIAVCCSSFSYSNRASFSPQP